MSDLSVPAYLFVIDHRGGRGLADPEVLETAVREAAAAAGADILTAEFALRPDASGPAGVAWLRNGRITAQCWAELEYAQFDLIIPGEGAAQRAADQLARSLLPDWAKVTAVPLNHLSHLPPD
ncbi:S-adenosylmethionine decarboxylase [Pseudooceanicola sp. C21-150M6]|uniref:S-adenosylmethionine decarboxylase n=1 Tax=Pseudooceanicola sp. C21-150M6 TaxID=3434355 RepID=UPI003D7FBAD9